MPSDVTSGAVGRWFGLSQLSMVVFTPVMGILCDRIDRVTALAVGMAVGALGFLALGTIEDPLNSPWMYLVAILGGAGEACVIVSGPALVGQEAPARLRGSVIGVVSLCGAVGVLIHSKVSGVLFDGWDIQAPFLYMAILNALVAAVAVAVRMRVGARAKPPTPAAAE